MARARAWLIPPWFSQQSSAGYLLSCLCDDVSKVLNNKIEGEENNKESLVAFCFFNNKRELPTC